MQESAHGVCLCDNAFLKNLRGCVSKGYVVVLVMGKCLDQIAIGCMYIRGLKERSRNGSSMFERTTGAQA